MPAEKLGDASCPLCGGTARVSLSKSQYAVMTMNCCNAQLFTRSPRSDELVRDRIKKPAAAPAAQPGGGVPAAPVDAPKPAPAPNPSTLPVAPPVAAPVPAAAPRRGFGMMQW